MEKQYSTHQPVPGRDSRAHSYNQSRARRRLIPWIAAALLISAGVYAFLWQSPCLTRPSSKLSKDRTAPIQYPELCHQVDPLLPGGMPLDSDPVRQKIRDKTWQDQALSTFQEAVTYRTVAYDEMMDPDYPLDSPAYAAFNDFRHFLATKYPHVNRTMEPRLINQHGLLYIWKGSDLTLKPTLLLAHQDVVPVSNETLDEWTFPPWSGAREVDPKTGVERIYGRGSVDDKNPLIAIMDAMELLIEQGDFKPRRSIILAFGFDEEIGGPKGAATLSPAVESCVGKDGIAVLVDEGSADLEMFGQHFVSPGVAEKGYLDVQVDVRIPGGHSSFPVQHTGIGIIGDFIARLENDPYDTYLSPSHPVLQHLGCALEHASLPEPLRTLTKQRLYHSHSNTNTNTKNDTLAAAFSSYFGPSDRNAMHWLMTTTQAATIISGGFKINAMPDLVTVKINHRVHIHETLDSVKRKIESHAADLASRFNLTVFGFDTAYSPSASRSVSLKTLQSLAVAPLTPTYGSNLYDILAGTIRAVMGEDKIVSPLMSTGNTDTKHYWNLTRNIFRFFPGAGEAEFSRIHTVDESMSVAGHLTAIDWYVVFVRNMDEADVDGDGEELKVRC